MPPIARIYVKTAFAYLIVAFALGALMLLDRWLTFSRWLRVLYFSQLHLLVVGWMSQLALGVAYWMFPRYRERPDPRGPDRLAWTAYGCLNIGLLLRFLCEPFYLMGPRPWLAALLALSGVLQAVAVTAFGVLIWGRIRPLR